MPAGKIMAAAIFALAWGAGVISAAAQTQQSEASVQSAVRDLRDRLRTSPATPTRAVAETPPRPEKRSEPGACARQTAKSCQRDP
jgi:hypothetical protein